MSSESPKQAIFAQLALVAKSLAHPHRLALLEQLAQGERSVEVLADRIGIAIANTSHHLQQMRRGGLVDARRDGKYVVYRVSDNSVLDLVSALGTVATTRIAEVDRLLQRYFYNRDSLEAVSRKDLMRRIKDGTVTVLDVRPEDEFALGHLPGAVNIPLDKLKRRMAKLDPSKEIIAYCRGAYCVLSFETVAILRDKGFKVRRLEDGYPEWRAAGLPVEPRRPSHG